MEEINYAWWDLKDLKKPKHFKQRKQHKQWYGGRKCVTYCGGNGSLGWSKCGLQTKESDKKERGKGRLRPECEGSR